MDTSQNKDPKTSSKGKTHKKKNSMSVVHDSDEPVCIFCQQPQNQQVELGNLYHTDDIYAHHFCLLFSSALEQNGEDEEGILGFLKQDIIKEYQRGKKLKCVYCGLVGATVGCSQKICRKSYHFPCGLKEDAQFEFADNFRSYCIKHREFQKGLNIGKVLQCPLCLEYEEVNPNSFLYPPCCSKDSWIHKKCIQKLALNAGYFFKCPLCNDKEIFVKKMLTLGVYVPEQDASWEKEPNAFSELLERPSLCDAKACSCQRGRSYKKDAGRWKILVCNHCGSAGIHAQCSGLSDNDQWDCFRCQEILSNVTPKRKLQDAECTENKRRKSGDLSGSSNKISKYELFNLEHLKPFDMDTSVSKYSKFCDLDPHVTGVSSIEELLLKIEHSSLWDIEKIQGAMIKVGEDPSLLTTTVLMRFKSRNLSYEHMRLLAQFFNSFGELAFCLKLLRLPKTQRRTPHLRQKITFLEVCFKNSIRHAIEDHAFDVANLTEKNRYEVLQTISLNCPKNKLIQPSTIDIKKTSCYPKILKDCQVLLSDVSQEDSNISQVTNEVNCSDGNLSLDTLQIDISDQPINNTAQCKSLNAFHKMTLNKSNANQPKPKKTRMLIRDSNKSVQLSISDFLIKIKK